MQAPAFLVAFLIAELFYKFKSFALECLAFLATWFLIELVITTGVGYLVSMRTVEESPRHNCQFRSPEPADTA